MTENKTLGILKKRIFDALDEYSENDAQFVTNSNRKILERRLPDAVTSSLVRMYESLAVGKGRCTSKVYRPRLIFECRTIKKEGTQAYIDTAAVAVSFGFYGSGSLVIRNADGDVVFSADCGGDGVKGFWREFAEFANAGNYSIAATDGLEITDLAIYENEVLPDVNSIPMRGYTSFQLPCDFGGFIAIEGDERLVLQVNMSEGARFAEICDNLLEEKNEVCFEYKKKVPEITGETQADFVFDLSPLAFEALVCLSAAELCREEESAMYTRLLYKYSDLEQGLYKSKYADVFKRNVFYKKGRRMR